MMIAALVVIVSEPAQKQSTDDRFACTIPAAGGTVASD
jgi:hypothetical protein